MKWHLLECYGVSSFTIQEDHTLLFEMDANEEAILAWLLSCGDKVTVLEPQSIQERMLQVASAIAAKYQE